MKSLFIFILFIFTCFFGIAQLDSGIPDSLRQILFGEKKDSSRVLLFAQLSKKYLESKPETALNLAQEGLFLSRKIKFSRGEVQCLKAMGAIWGVTGNYPKGLETLFQALKISEKIDDNEGNMLCYITIGVNYSHRQDYKQSLYYFFKSNEISRGLHDERYLLFSLLDIGDSYEKLNQLDSALRYTQECYSLAVQFKNEELRGYSLDNMGNIKAKMNENLAAMEYYRQCIPLFSAYNILDGICEARMGIASIFKKQGNGDSALKYARQSLVLAEQSGFTRHVLNASNFLASYYETTARIDSAYEYQKISIQAKDSLFSQEKVKSLQNLSFAEHLRQQEIAEEKEKAAEVSKKNIQMAAIGIFIPIFFGIIVFIRNKKIKRKTVEYLGLFGLLMLFEFIALLIHPYLENWTNDTPVLMLAALVILASLLVPLHHKLEHKLKEKLGYKKIHETITI
jgi:tetratricopeptide (TPR) repeat protein